MAIQYIGGESSDQLIAKARRLADDIARIAAGDAPSTADLAAAPLLDLWQPAATLLPALGGIVRGHPTLRDNTAVVASEMFVIDQTRGWARTWSRFYVLSRTVTDALARRR
jgi:glutathione S-transferase